MHDISKILECWAGWARSDNSGVDYSSIAAGFKGLLPQSSKNFLSCSDNDGLIIDSCLSRLKQKKEDEHLIIVAHYFYGLSKRSIAKKMKKDEKIIRIQIQMAEGFIEGCLAALNIKLDLD